MAKDKDFVAPVDHSLGSAAASTTAGAAKGGFFGALKGVGIIASIGAAVGLVTTLVLTGVITLPAFVGVALSAQAGNLAWAVGGTLLGAGIFTAIGGPIAATLGGLFGGVKGGGKALDQVHKERGAAKAIQAQIDILKAQTPSPAATNIYVPTATNDNTVVNNRYSFPAQGTNMNPALASIQGATVQYDGLAAGHQLAAMR